MLQILIIDDDKNIRRYLKTILLAAGYTPICTETADEALHIMETNTIALIILDIMLPGTDGFTFTKLLRDCKNDIPILMHTAKQLPDDIKTGFLAGADDYMTKRLMRMSFFLESKRFCDGQKSLRNTSFALDILY